MKKDIFSDFFGKIDLQFTDEFQYPSEEDSNIGLSVDLTEFLRLASSSPQTDQKFRNNLYRILVKLNIDNKKLKKRDYLSPEERREILIQCEKTNQRVAREYLGREDGKLFLEPWPDPDDSWEPYEGLSIEEIIPIFTRVLHKMHQDFNKNVHIFQREQDLIQKMSNWKKKLLSGIFPPWARSPVSGVRSEHEYAGAVITRFESVKIQFLVVIRQEKTRFPIKSQTGLSYANTVTVIIR